MTVHFQLDRTLQKASRVVISYIDSQITFTLTFFALLHIIGTFLCEMLQGLSNLTIELITEQKMKEKNTLEINRVVHIHS